MVIASSTMACSRCTSASKVGPVSTIPALYFPYCGLSFSASKSLWMSSRQTRWTMPSLSSLGRRRYKADSVNRKMIARFNTAKTSFSFSPANNSSKRSKKRPAGRVVPISFISVASSSFKSLEAYARSWFLMRRASLYRDSTVPSSSAVRKLFKSAMLTLLLDGSSRNKPSCTWGALCRKLSRDLARRHPGFKPASPDCRTWNLPRAMHRMMTKGVLPTPGHPRSNTP